MSQRLAMPSRFWLLTDAVCAGTLTADEQIELNVLLAADPVARSCYLDYCQIHGDLSFLLRANRATQRAMNQIHKGPAPSPAPRSSLLGFLDSVCTWLPGGELTVGALILSCVAAAFYGLSTLVFKPGAERSSVVMSRGRPASGGRSPQANSAPNFLPTTAFAHLVPRAGCVWAPEDPLAKVPAGEGSDLIAGQELRLVAGIADIELTGGVQVAIAGPTQLRFDSAAICRLESGRLYAQVPHQAAGFTVATPAAEVIDLGTEFGVEVDGQGATELHVIRGRVELKPAAKNGVPNHRSQQVAAGAAVRVSAMQPAAESIPFNFARFHAARSALRPRRIVGHFPDIPAGLPRDAATLRRGGGTPIALESATATFSQAGQPAEQSIDGITTGNGGWAIHPNEGADATISFQTISPVPKAGTLTFDLFHDFAGGFSENLGHFKLWATTDGGTTWSELVPRSVTDVVGSTFTVLEDNSILVGGVNPFGGEIYTVVASTTLVGINGFRLEALTDPSLPVHGPGRSSDGNFVLTEFQASIADVLSEKNR